MKTAKITINGVEHLLCFSLRVVKEASERYGGVEKIGDAITDGDSMKSLDEIAWLLSAMMRAGVRYAQVNDLETAPALSADEFLDICDIQDIATLRGKIFETIVSGNKPDVEVDSAKNTEATPVN